MTILFGATLFFHEQPRTSTRSRDLSAPQEIRQRRHYAPSQGAQVEPRDGLKGLIEGVD